MQLFLFLSLRTVLELAISTVSLTREMTYIKSSVRWENMRGEYKSFEMAGLLDL
jgi:hypothetical protein